MRRGPGIVAAILVILLLVGVGVGAYNWGVSDGIEQSGKAVEVVRYVGHGGYFPFGIFLFFPLVFLALFAFRGAMWRRHWGDHGHDHEHGPGRRGPGGPWEQRFEDWHRQQHEVGEGAGGSAGGEPSSV